MWQTNLKEEAFGIIILASNCINNIYRFGKNGFNSSFGNSYLTDFKIARIELLVKCLKQIKNKIYFYDDYDKCMDIYNALYFIDPPYYKRSMGNCIFSENNLNELMLKINFKNDVIYTDIENEYGEKYFKNNVKLELLKSIRPGRNKEIFHNEKCYYNIYGVN